MLTAFSEFLTLREDRFKPTDKRIQSFQRINKIDFSGKIYLSDKSSNTDMILVKKGDLVISGINIEKGALAVYEGDDDITATIHYSSYSFDQKIIDVNYLKWFLKSKTFLNLVKEQVPGGIKTEIKPKHLLPLKIDLPDLEDQKKIVKRFIDNEKEYSSLTHEISHQQLLLKKVRQAILQEAVQGKLVPQDLNDEPASELLKRIKAEKEKLIAEGKIRKEKSLPPIKEEEIPFELPKGWIWCRLGEITNSISTGPFGTMLHKSDYVHDGIPLVNPTNMSDGKIVSFGIKTISSTTKGRLSSYVLEEGDVVIARRGDLGRCAIVSVKEDGWLCGTGSFFLKFGELIDRQFFVKYFGSYYSVKYLMGSSVGSTMNNLNHKILNLLLIPLAPLKEQQRIVEKIKTLFSNCDQLEKQIEENAKNSELLLQAVLKEAFEGNL